MGASFAHVPLLIALGAQFGMPTILGAQLAGGFVAILVGLFYNKLSKIFTPLVTGTVVFTIRFSLYPTAITYMAVGSGAPDFGSVKNWALAIFTLVIVTFFNYFTKGICKMASILIGIVCGYLAALALGMISFESIGEASWFQFTPPLYFGMKFDITAIISMAIMFVVGSLEIMGDFTSTAGGGLNRPVQSEEMSGGIIGNGIISIIDSLFGGLPTATFSQNVGIVIMTIRRYCHHDKGRKPRGSGTGCSDNRAGRTDSQVFCPADYCSLLRTGRRYRIRICHDRHDRHQACGKRRT